MIKSLSGSLTTHKNVITDKAWITTALRRLTGPASKYMKPWIEKLMSGQTIGTWDEFTLEMEVQYGQKDEKEGAKNKIKALFDNKNLAHKNFIQYCEKFCTLSRIVNYTDDFMIDKLNLVMENRLRNVLIGWQMANKMPSDWKEYLNVVLNLYKQMHPNKGEERVFSLPPKDDNTMEVDNANKKNKGKGKRANSTEKKLRYCYICKYNNHNTENCRFNMKWQEKDGQNGEKKDKEKEKPSQQGSGNWNKNKEGSNYGKKPQQHKA
jgi:hypothetical protein